MLRRLLPLTALAAACPKQVETGALAADEVMVVHRAPIQCTQARRVSQDDLLEAGEPRGCNASVRFRLAPSGYRDVDVPFFRDATRPTSRATVEGEVVGRTLLLRDPAGERLWSAEVPDDLIPWTPDGPCARPASGRTFDLNPWQVLVVRVLTRDTLGTTRPLAEAQADTLRLVVHAPGAPPVRPVTVASTTHEGVWAAIWCAADAGPYELELDVRGASQGGVDRFAMPDGSRDTYTFLDYELAPLGGGEGL